jgi:hypothetical protein
MLPRFTHILLCAFALLRLCVRCVRQDVCVRLNTFSYNSLKIRSNSYHSNSYYTKPRAPPQQAEFAARQTEFAARQTGFAARQTGFAARQIGFAARQIGFAER